MTKLVRAGGEWKACCPFHTDRTPSFTIYADDRRFICFGCGEQGDVLDFVMKLHRVGLREALEIVDREGVGRARNTEVSRICPDQRVRQAQVEAIWTGAQHAPGTAAETYLRARGLHGPIPDCIRFARLPLGRSAPMPALIASVAGPSGLITGIQRTFLRDDGTTKAALPGGKAKLSLGRIKGGAVQLSPAGAELILTGGLEDALTLQQELGVPAWAATGESMMAAVILPPVVRRVIIGADNDGAGEAAAKSAGWAFALHGVQARIIRPAAPYKDFNDQLRDIRR